MTDLEVDLALGMTPCVCGDCETWHQECYRGKTQAEIDAAYKVAYKKARLFLKRRAENVAMGAMTIAAKEKPVER